MQTSIPSLDVPPFRPRFPWWGGDLQTMANRLLGTVVDLAPHSAETLRVALPDGTGDTLLCTLHRPAVPRAGTALVLLIHGLTGSEDSHYIRSQARLLLERGHRVLRLNLRGAGPSRSLCSEHYFAGRSADFRLLLSLLPADLTRDGLMAVGYSLGGAMLLKYLGEEGAASPLRAAASVCAPIDLAVTCRNMMRARNAVYHRHLLGQMKVEATGAGAVLSGRECEAIMKSRTVWEYDDVFIAPRYGFGSAANYYESCKPVRFMAGIRVPTLMLAAGDDPWIPMALYRACDWAGNKALVPLLPDSGGHVGFHGAGSRQPWCDGVIARFLEHG